MKKKKDISPVRGEEMFRGPRKPLPKAPKNQKRKIFDEIEEEEDIESLFESTGKEDLFDDQFEDEENA